MDRISGSSRDRFFSLVITPCFIVFHELSIQTVLIRTITMTSLLKFGSQGDKKRGLLVLFILHSLSRQPRSGYDIRKEIEVKTKGMWIPSKGALYPVLHQLEDERLIMISDTGKRSRVVFCLTPKGEETLRTFRERSRESHKKMALYKNLILDIFGGEKITLKGLLFEIKTAVEELPPGTEDRAAPILEHCLDDLKRIS
jgi:DNA-binding PadR family transcriptional regulator